MYIDLMVPFGLAENPGRRSVNLTPHAKNSVRWAKGLEGASVERALMTIKALDPADQRSRTVWVAGAAALLVAKAHKFSERVGDGARVNDKDALDVLRLLRAFSTQELVQRMTLLLKTPQSASVAREAVGFLREHFSASDQPGVEAAVRAAGPAADSDTIRNSLIALMGDFVLGIEEAGREQPGIPLLDRLGNTNDLTDAEAMDIALGAARSEAPPPTPSI